MSKVNLIKTMIMTLFLLLIFSACSGGNGPGAEKANNTTWDELIWDDGIIESNRNWAD